MRVRHPEETDLKKSRFNEAQIIGVLRDQEGGSPTAEICRRHGISEQTLYRWKARYSGMRVAEARVVIERWRLDYNHIRPLLAGCRRKRCG